MLFNNFRIPNVFRRFFFNIFMFPIIEYIAYILDTDGTEIFNVFNYIATTVLTIFYDFSLLYIYIRCLHVYAKWWYSKYWKESERYGTNEREHEILIRVTRFCVIFTIATIVDVLLISVQIWNILIDSIIPVIIEYIFEALSYFAHASAIYFSYEFGHSPYYKIYGKIHDRVYQISEKVHQRKTHDNYDRL